jgi:hypothetical protein
MELSTIDGVKEALSQGLLTTKGAIHCCLRINKGARPCELSQWLGLPASTIYGNLKVMELRKKKVQGSVALSDNGQLVRERPGAVYAVE